MAAGFVNLVVWLVLLGKFVGRFQVAEAWGAGIMAGISLLLLYAEHDISSST